MSSKQQALRGVRKAHPIERALAMQKLRSLLTTEKIRIYLMERGEPCADRMEALGHVLGTIGVAAVYGGMPRDDHRLRIIMGAISAMNQMIQSDSWDPINAPSIDRAIDCAEELNKTNTADNTMRAFVEVLK